MLERQLKSVDLEWNISGEGDFLDNFWRWGMKVRVAKRIRYPCSSYIKRCTLEVCSYRMGFQANALSVPPEEYSRKAETQRTRRATKPPAEDAP